MYFAGRIFSILSSSNTKHSHAAKFYCFGIISANCKHVSYQSLLVSESVKSFDTSSINRGMHHTYAKVYRRFIRVHKKLLEDVKNLKLKWLQDMDPDDFWNSLYEKPKLVENETWGGRLCANLIGGGVSHYHYHYLYYHWMFKSIVETRIHRCSQC